MPAISPPSIPPEQQIAALRTTLQRRGDTGKGPACESKARHFKEKTHTTTRNKGRRTPPTPPAHHSLCVSQGNRITRPLPAVPSYRVRAKHPGHLHHRRSVQRNSVPFETTRDRGLPMGRFTAEQCGWEREGSSFASNLGS